jgi:ribose/xylose/arabinose/galactoside ABC-type transport system permease subunit
VLAALGILIVVFNELSPYFLTTSNFISNMGAQDAEIGIIALGMAIVIASGGIDLSVGAILGLSSVVLGASYDHGVPLVAGVVICLAVGLACGLANGALVVLLRLHPLLVTLGTLALYRGLALGISNGGAFSVFPSGFEELGGTYFFGATVPSQLIPWAVVGVLVYVITARMPAGRKLIAVGVNETAAALSGVRVGGVRLAVYGASGLLCGVASVIYTSRVFSARGDAGAGLELLAIAAVVVGGASIHGGEISVLRTTLGVILIGLIPNGFVLAGIDTSWTYVAIGVVMIGAVLLNELLAGRGVALLRSRLQEIFDFGDLDQTERGPDGQLDGDMQAGVGLGSKAQRGGAEAEEGPGDRERGTNDEFDVHKEPA